MEITGNRGTKKTAYIGFLFEMVYVILCGFKNLEHQQVFENDEDKFYNLCLPEIVNHRKHHEDGVVGGSRAECRDPDSNMASAVRHSMN